MTHLSEATSPAKQQALHCNMEHLTHKFRHHRRRARHLDNSGCVFQYLHEAAVAARGAASLVVVAPRLQARSHVRQHRPRLSVMYLLEQDNEGQRQPAQLALLHRRHRLMQWLVTVHTDCASDTDDLEYKPVHDQAPGWHN